MIGELVMKNEQATVDIIIELIANIVKSALTHKDEEVHSNGSIN